MRNPTVRTLLDRFPGRLVLLAGLALACTEPAEPAGSAIGPGELAARIEAGDAPLVLDVRTADEFARGHLPGAVNLPHDEIEQRAAVLPGDRSREIVVHCQRGGRAQKAEESLRALGFTNVRDLTGHFEAWQAQALPTE